MLSVIILYQLRKKTGMRKVIEVQTDDESSLIPLNLCHFLLFLRLILPYERFTKGEEDKPLPPVKPRKQEGSVQEAIVKTKMMAIKRPKDEQKPVLRNEMDISAKVPELVSLWVFNLSKSST